ncbi:MAG: hypothetical protein Q8781_02105 [Candidatus Phytoplasma stylosanthis]|uniref:hypothetical protein n=1 Tax=Candidatus Phytoplasma stylosanthis TaxID=2798314 RepID=UPI00293B78B6|nr:hypothetical protein [Candidatus Phytoplasma stylosanthis]MDV3168007.1 hypothetical protein [Candidatus Phytoplasma stylosanthis]MDV3171077.1 hypothetical protein [Candidatus Phytoplasma stylosanthis]MDV3174261.1 hypothetical protein [Candidatus Phytoplasma stylosanthis]MDV3202625.1 hypothetical protein [Candidatus Phytoplasma stylosanthis]
MQLNKNSNNISNKIFFLVLISIISFFLFQIFKYKEKQNRKKNSKLNEENIILDRDNKNSFIEKESLNNKSNDNNYSKEIKSNIDKEEILESKKRLMLNKLPLNISIIYKEENPDIIEIISPDLTKLEYNYVKGKINKLIDFEKNIKEYDGQNGHLLKEKNKNGTIKEYNTCLKKEVFYDGTIREYFNFYFKDISPDKKIIKEYILDSKKLIKIILNNNYIREYGLYTNKLIKEILPNGEIKIYDYKENIIIEKRMPDGKIEQYDKKNGFLMKEIFPDGKIIEAIKEYNENNQITKITLSNKNIVEFEENSDEIKQIIFPDGTKKKVYKEYNKENNKLIKWISADGKHIKEFDSERGVLIKEKLPDGVIREYDPETNLLTKEIFKEDFYVSYEYFPNTNEIFQTIFSNGVTVKHDLNF